MAEKLAIHGGNPLRIRPFPDWPIFGEEEEDTLVRALRSGKWGRQAGSEVAAFEREFAEYHRAKHGIAVVNGTVALRLALMAADIAAGDEVIVPPYTFMATASAVLETNAVPVFADLDLDSFNIDPAAIEAAITPRTRAIIVVHLGGLPVDLDAISDIARRRGLILIEDAAHAHGAEYRGRRVGAIGDLGTFSFQSSKNLTCGEGGIILANNEELAERCRSIHNCGRLPGRAWYEHFLLGGNYRLSEFQGAVLNAQWRRFDVQATARETNGKYLSQRLARIPGIVPQYRGPECTRHAYHLFAFRLLAEEFGMSRERLLEALAAEGVPCSFGYPLPLYRQPLFLDRTFGAYGGDAVSRPLPDYRRENCPNCETICTSQGVWLEHRLLLGTREDMDDIADALEKIHASRAVAVADR
ncbi:MAG: DegT/DnrJ/EryC1/StrS family aminotransferase [Pirellulales bacterium]|nr:DegT/DnrJ/EryC1/StrS family aminotransferase [Pirellulales bacterium]